MDDRLVSVRVRASWLCLLVAWVAASAACAGAEESPVVTVSDEIYVSRTAVWDTRIIPVCWENPDPANLAERRWVQDSVARTWSNVAAVDFVGWGACAPGARGIRIRIEDGHPLVNCLGRWLDDPTCTCLGVGPYDASRCDALGLAPGDGCCRRLGGTPGGMRLNFTYAAWDASCPASFGRECCIRSTAVHEFGHALGFAHEQNRPDTDPRRCTADDSPQGSNGDGDAPAIGPWDQNSVMNYCGRSYNNGGNLSPIDAQGARAVYGHRDPTLPLLNLSCAALGVRPECLFTPTTAQDCAATCCDGHAETAAACGSREVCEDLGRSMCHGHGDVARLSLPGALIAAPACPRGGHDEVCRADRTCAGPDHSCVEGVCRTACTATCQDGQSHGPYSASGELECERWAHWACAGSSVREASFNGAVLARNDARCGDLGDACCAGADACPLRGECVGGRCRNRCAARCADGQLAPDLGEAADDGDCLRRGRRWCDALGGLLRARLNDRLLRDEGVCGAHGQACCGGASACDEPRARCAGGRCRNDCYARCRDATLMGPGDASSSRACVEWGVGACRGNGGAVRVQFNGAYVLNRGRTGGACGGVGEVFWLGAACDHGLERRGLRCEDPVATDPSPAACTGVGEPGVCEVCCGSTRASIATRRDCCPLAGVCGSGAPVRHRFTTESMIQSSVVAPLACP